MEEKLVCLLDGIEIGRDLRIYDNLLAELIKLIPLEASSEYKFERLKSEISKRAADIKWVIQSADWCGMSKEIIEASKELEAVSRELELADNLREAYAKLPDIISKRNNLELLLARFIGEITIAP